ncbi:hypothetical protein Atai01_15090 [Amycolatopsis taiwanensis]|uniref:Peptidase C39-like domain-containing protein n=1 Tax=Amycolatopsis taiwanensis TaxID=342230 RepID=A0A9W6QXW8_9PSEU|nr:hypothetical protein Atai01_15090 [Amycolatopsis taiwanensis]
MPKHRNAGDRTPKAVVRALIDRFHAYLDGHPPKAVLRALVFHLYSVGRALQTVARVLVDRLHLYSVGRRLQAVAQVLADRLHLYAAGRRLQAVARVLADRLHLYAAGRRLQTAARALVDRLGPYWRGNSPEAGARALVERLFPFWGGRTPEAVVRTLVGRLYPSSDGRVWPRTVSGKALSAVVISGAIVAVAHPLVAGVDPDPVPPAAQAAPQAPVPAAPEMPAAPSEPEVAPQAPQPVTKSLPVVYQAQRTEYWCGPTAARIALSSMTNDLPDQRTLAAQLGTTVDGTDYIGQVVAGLNSELAGTGISYVTRDWGGRSLTSDMMQQLWSDTVRDVDAGKAMVANIVAKPSNRPPGYPSNQTIYHYVAVVGYNSADGTVHISDPARFSGIEDYWLSLDHLASLIQPKGYAA